MKKLFLAIALLALAGSQVQTAQAGGLRVAVGFGGGYGGYYAAPAPAYYYPPVAYVAPVPHVVYAAPVVCPPTVYVAPPVVGVGFGYRPFFRGYWGPRFFHRW